MKGTVLLTLLVLLAITWLIYSFSPKSPMSYDPAVQSTYTPTLTNVANTSALTANVCQYARIGNMVFVSGSISVDPTTTLTLTQVGISLPIASNLTAATQCAGTGAGPSITSLSGGILGDATNDRATLQFLNSDISNQPWYFTFSYIVL